MRLKSFSLLLGLILILALLPVTALADTPADCTPYNLTAVLMSPDETHPYGSVLLTFKIDNLPRDNATEFWQVSIEKKIGESGEWIETLSSNTSIFLDEYLEDGVFRVEQIWNEDYAWEDEISISFRVRVLLYDETWWLTGESPCSNVATVGLAAFYSNASDYAKGFLDDAEEMGIITDSMQGQDMTAYITREEFAEIAVKFYEMVTGADAMPETPNPFSDTNNPEILKAYKLKITAGVPGGKFEPDSNLLRQQMATMITNTLRACFDDFVIDTSGQPDFKDHGSFAAYAIDSAKFMAKYGITAGDGKGNFVPNNYCTRQEAIIFLVKAYTLQDDYLP